MALGLILIIAALAGLGYGILKKNNALLVASAILLTAIAAVMVYFYNNPY